MVCHMRSLQLEPVTFNSAIAHHPDACHFCGRQCKVCVRIRRAPCPTAAGNIDPPLPRLGLGGGGSGLETGGKDGTRRGRPSFDWPRGAVRISLFLLYSISFFGGEHISYDLTAGCSRSQLQVLLRASRLVEKAAERDAAARRPRCFGRMLLVSSLFRTPKKARRNTMSTPKWPSNLKKWFPLVCQTAPANWDCSPSLLTPTLGWLCP